MIEVLKVLPLDNTDGQFMREVYRYNSFQNYTVCRTCGSILHFEESDIDRTKILPHVPCPTCDNLIQLPSRYYKFPAKTSFNMNVGNKMTYDFIVGAQHERSITSLDQTIHKLRIVIEHDLKRIPVGRKLDDSVSDSSIKRLDSKVRTLNDQIALYEAQCIRYEELTGMHVDERFKQIPYFKR